MRRCFCGPRSFLRGGCLGSLCGVDARASANVCKASRRKRTHRGPSTTVAFWGKSERLRKLWNARLLTQSVAAAVGASTRIGAGIARAASRGLWPDCAVDQQLPTAFEFGEGCTDPPAASALTFTGNSRGGDRDRHAPILSGLRLAVKLLADKGGTFVLPRSREPAANLQVKSTNRGGLFSKATGWNAEAGPLRSVAAIAAAAPESGAGGDSMAIAS